MDFQKTTIFQDKGGVRKIMDFPHASNDTSNARLWTRSALSRKNTTSSHNQLSIYSLSKMIEASMTFSFTFDFSNLENRNVNFLQKNRGFPENLWFSTES
jgi:hypothetical protein